MNKILLTGRLTKEPELKETSNNNVFSNFTLAVNRYLRNKDVEKTDFIPVIIWGKKAEMFSKYIKKGDLVWVSGRLQIRSFENPEGVKKYVSEVVANEIQLLESCKSHEIDKEA